MFPHSLKANMLGDPVCVGVDAASFLVSGKQPGNAFGRRGFLIVVDHLAAAALLDDFCEFRFKFRSLKNLSHFTGVGKKQAFDLMKLNV